MNPALKGPSARLGALTSIPALLAAILLLTACSSTPSVPTTSLPTATTLGPLSGSSYEEVNFDSEDGLVLSGRLYRPWSEKSFPLFAAPGKSGVVLCHMYPSDQASWDTEARLLSREGLTVLTFDFRGYGKSQGSKDIRLIDRDVTAAVGFLRDVGVRELVLVGASMGGTASLKAAGQIQTLSSVRVAGVATLSAPVEFMGISARESLPGLQLPLLFVAAEGDSGAAGARELESLSGGLGDLQIVPGGDHGTDLLTGSQTEQVRLVLLEFLQRCMPSGGE
jgi:alpha-beta hydrolase superfamily lysophospholipase